MPDRALTLKSLLCAIAFAGIAPAAAQGAPQSQSQGTAKAGGAEFGTESPANTPTVPGTVGRVVNGIAHAPADAPEQVKRVIWAANRIVGMPYRLGGGHVLGFEDDAYDCSGTVSFALHGAELLRRPRDSRSFARWGAAGVGAWITVYTNPSHAYLQVAGLRLDTSAAGERRSSGKGPRWRRSLRSHRGFEARHPVGL